MEWSPLSFILNSNRYFYIGEDKWELENGMLRVGDNEVSIFNEPTSEGTQDCPPYAKPNDKRPSHATFPNPHGGNDLEGYAVFQHTGSWTSIFAPTLKYVDNNNACNLFYSVIMTSDCSIIKHINGSQNGTMIHNGNYSHNVNSNAPPSVWFWGPTYSFNLWGSRSTVVLFSEYLSPNVALYYTPYSTITFQGNTLGDFIKVYSWTANCNVPGGCCGVSTGIVY